MTGVVVALLVVKVAFHLKYLARLAPFGKVSPGLIGCHVLPRSRLYEKSMSVPVGVTVSALKVSRFLDLVKAVSELVYVPEDS